jgi:alkaline phosphatase D
MRIAFASCMCTRVFGDQPVWTRIVEQQPDHLVLLGDSIYLDIKTAPAPMPQEMGEFEFAQHLLALYNELLAQREFKALVKTMPAGTVHSIWDDHDFLWDNALGAEVAKQPQVDGPAKIRLSTACQEAFRAALAQGGTGFPTDPSDGRLWDANQPPLATPSLPLAPDLWLHLLDGRSVRTRTWLLAESKRTQFGDAQKARIGAAVSAAPEAIHLMASGSTVAGWQRYARDRQWLDALAAKQRLLVLSGDIHRNQTDAFFTPGWPLHEATSSGAAVKDAVVIGSTLQNFGLLEIEPDTVTIRLFNKTGEEKAKARTLARATWLPR